MASATKTKRPARRRQPAVSGRQPRNDLPPVLTLVSRVNFAAELDVDPKTITNWAEEGLCNGTVFLTLTRIGGRVFVSREDWAAFQEELAKKKGQRVGRTRLHKRQSDQAQDARLRAAGLRFE